MTANLKLAIVTWFDSSSMVEWSSIDTIKAESIHLGMKSVGWVTNETEELIAISANAGNTHFGNTTFIPRVNITNIEYIQYIQENNVRD